MQAALAIFLGCATVKLFALDLAGWGLTLQWVYGGVYGETRYLAARVLDFGMVLLALTAGWWWMGSAFGSGRRAPAFGYTALLVLFVYATLEWNTWLGLRHREFQNAGLSILWALFAAGFLVGGIWKSVRTLRLIGLILFVVVVGKVFFHDLSGMPVVGRVVAFMVLGVTLILGSFAYIYASRKFIREPGSDEQ